MFARERLLSTVRFSEGGSLNREGDRKCLTLATERNLTSRVTLKSILSGRVQAQIAPRLNDVSRVVSHRVGGPRVNNKTVGLLDITGRLLFTRFKRNRARDSRDHLSMARL